MEVNLLFPVHVKCDETDQHVFFVNFLEQKVFDSLGKSIGDDLRKEILKDLQQQQQLTEVEPPTDLVKKVLDTQKEIGKPDYVRSF